MKYTKEEILSKVDHTLLKPEATWPQIQALCDDAIKYHTASVCINTCYVKQAVQYMAGRVAVCCVVGFLWVQWILLPSALKQRPLWKTAPRKWIWSSISAA